MPQQSRLVSALLLPLRLRSTDYALLSRSAIKKTGDGGGTVRKTVTYVPNFFLSTPVLTSMSPTSVRTSLEATTCGYETHTQRRSSRCRSRPHCGPVVIFFGRLQSENRGGATAVARVKNTAAFFLSAVVSVVLLLQKTLQHGRWCLSHATKKYAPGPAPLLPVRAGTYTPHVLRCSTS